MNELSPTLRPVTITPKPRQGRFQRLSPVQFIELTGLVAFAQACLAFAQAVRGRRFLPAPGRGRPKVYSDLCIFLTPIIQRVWQKSNEGIIQYLYDHPIVAVALVYPVDLHTGQVSIIHPAHYGRRKRQLGLFVYFVAFVALARSLIQSDRWQPAWELLRADFRKTVTVCDTRPTLPNVLPREQTFVQYPIVMLNHFDCAAIPVAA